VHNIDIDRDQWACYFARHFMRQEKSTYHSSATESPLMVLALALVIPAVGLDHVLHTDPPALVTMPVYQVLHFLGDTLLALPLGALAIWSGRRLSTRLGLRSRTTSEMAAQASAMALLFALLLVPGAVLHELTDAMTHAHLLLGVQSHAAGAQSLSLSAAVLAFLSHALVDGIEGQLLGFPTLTLAMSWKKGT
jgi:hypothetical protein